MFAIICGIIFIAFTVFSVLPMFPLNWGADVIAFLKGSLPDARNLFLLLQIFKIYGKINYTITGRGDFNEGN